MDDWLDVRMCGWTVGAALVLDTPGEILMDARVKQMTNGWRNRCCLSVLDILGEMLASHGCTCKIDEEWIEKQTLS